MTDSIPAAKVIKPENEKEWPNSCPGYDDGKCKAIDDTCQVCNSKLLVVYGAIQPSSGKHRISIISSDLTDYQLNHAAWRNMIWDPVLEDYVVNPEFYKKDKKVVDKRFIP